jgi:hypothetical protein
VVPRKTRTIQKKFSLNELIDFQSLVVLSKTKKESDTQAAIDKFIQQFAWAQKLAQFLWQLHQAGHFEYALAYTSIQPLSDDVDVVRTEALRIQSILDDWLSHVERIRRNFYFVNFYRFV